MVEMYQWKLERNRDKSPKQTTQTLDLLKSSCNLPEVLISGMDSDFTVLLHKTKEAEKRSVMSIIDSLGNNILR